MTLLEFGVQKGYEKGFIKGYEKAKTESVLDLLEDLGTVPDSLRKDILAQTDLDTLTYWIKLAAQVENIESFIKEITPKLL